MSKISAGIGLGEIQTAIGDIDTITAIMKTVSTHVPEEEVQREWFEFFGRAIDQVTQRIEDVMGRTQ